MEPTPAATPSSAGAFASARAASIAISAERPPAELLDSRGRYAPFARGGGVQGHAPICGPGRRGRGRDQRARRSIRRSWAR